MNIEELQEQINILDDKINFIADPKLILERKKLISKIELLDPEYFKNIEIIEPEKVEEIIPEIIPQIETNLFQVSNEPKEEIIEVDNSALISELKVELAKQIRMKNQYKMDVDDEIAELEKQIKELTPPDPYEGAKLNFLDKISDDEASYFLYVCNDNLRNMSLKLHASGTLELGLSPDQNTKEQQEYFSQHYEELILKCKKLIPVQKRNKNKRELVDLTDIISGENWFEVNYPNGDIRYVQHSTLENLTEYYNRMKIYVASIIPVMYDKLTNKITQQVAV